MKPDFMERAAQILEEVRTRTGMGAVDAEVLTEILKDELNEYCVLVEKYYEEEYYNAIFSAHNTAYDEGYTSGYDDAYNAGYLSGYKEGLNDGYSAV